ncbi:MAG: hypothetical protein ABI700_07625 [Chloroflexota bacterium]
MTFFHHYRLYGLTVRSNQPLLYLHPLPPSPSVDSPDVEITINREVIAPPHLGDESQLLFDQPFPNQTVIRGWRTPSGILIVYTSNGEPTSILIDSSGNMRVSLAPSLPLENFSPIIYGTAFSAFLYFKGLTCLHASAVALADQAVLCVGASGIGKSTLAASLAERGLQFVTDDVGVLSETADALAVQPGCAAGRLRPPSSTLEAHLKEWLPLSTPETAVPIRLIYLLGATSGQPQIVPISKRDAFVMLARNHYAPALQPAASKPRSLDRLRRLIDQVPIRLLLRSRQLDDLPATVTLVERDLRATLLARS